MTKYLFFYNNKKEDIGYAVSYLKPKLVIKALNETIPFNTIETNNWFSFKSSRKKKRSILEPNTKLIVLHAFDLKFQLNLKPVKTRDFLSPNIFKSKNDSILNDCFYVGTVNEDLKSKAHINLCQQSQIVTLKI